MMGSRSSLAVSLKEDVRLVWVKEKMLYQETLKPLKQFYHIILTKD